MGNLLSVDYREAGPDCTEEAGPKEHLKAHRAVLVHLGEVVDLAVAVVLEAVEAEKKVFWREKFKIRPQTALMCIFRRENSKFDECSCGIMDSPARPK